MRGETRPVRRALTLAVSMVLVAGGLVAGLPPAAHADAGSGQILEPTADAFVSAEDRKSNYGRWGELRVDNSPVYWTYLRFVVPSGTSVTSASLRMWSTNDSDDGGTIYRVWSWWDETTITWDKRPSLSAAQASIGPVGLGDWMTVDVSSMITGPGTYSMAIVTPSDDGSWYVSREGPAGQRPQLVLNGTAPPAPPPPPPPPNGDPVVAAAGDIACAPTDPNFNAGAGVSTACRQKATSDLLVNVGLSAVLTLGDNQYENGTLSEFQKSFDLSWGRVKSIIHPAVGDHEYQDPGAGGYFSYFGQAAGDPAKGYYSYDVGAWHLIVLNSNCALIGGCGNGSPQDQWLEADLQAHPSTCTLAYWHVPRFSSGRYGNNWSVSPLWWRLYEYDVDVVLNGNTHSYERFAPQDPRGVADGTYGIRAFVVGTGGEDLYPFAGAQPNSEVRYAGGFGVLKLTLHDTSYDWRFVSVAGSSFSDTGHGACH